jgi:hypothetical protein
VTLHASIDFSAKGHAVVNQDIVTDDCGFSNYDTHAVVNYYTATDDGSRVDFNAG